MSEIQTFGRLLDHAAKTWPQRDAIIFPGHHRSYEELHAAAMTRAKQLVALGVEPGDHVGILLPTCIEFVEVMFGIAMAGAVMVPINARYRANEIQYLTENADLVTIVTTGQVAEGVNFVERLCEGLPGLDGAENPWALDVEAAPELRNVMVLGDDYVDGMLLEAAVWAEAREVPDSVIETAFNNVQGGDLAMILYTSGTTSNPKGCMISGGSLIANGRALAKAYEMTGDDKFWSPLPMFHIAATFPICACFDLGAAYVTMSYFEAGTALKLLEDTRSTVTYPCFVTIISDMINHPSFDDTDLSHVRVMNSNLAVQPPEFAEKLKQAMPQAIQVGTFGLSEASGSICSTPLDAPEEQRITRLGSPLPGQEVKICDPDTGEEVPTGERGEICARGPNIMMGYYKDPEKTAETLKDGWLHTGDIGSLDENGTIMFHGRFKDMLKVGGENVAAAEIEGLLQDHPAVKLAQVVGIPDPRLVEIPAAFVELQPGQTATEADLIAHFKGKVSSFKIPRHIRFVTEWPMSTTKIKKFALRDQLEAELAAEKGAAE
ncbi:MAG: class I adenylate-forming enzyme family protein [Alphaproteobacteria bacterium]